LSPVEGAEDAQGLDRTPRLVTVEKPHAIRRSPGGMLVDSGLDADPPAVGGAATRPAQRSIGLPATGGDQMTVAVELYEPPARRPRLVADHGAPALHAHGRIGVVQRP